MITSPIFTTDKTAEEITPDIARDYIKKHNSKELPRLSKLEDYYCGNHPINGRKKSDGLSNNIVMTNHAAYIAKFTAAYLVGAPVAYSAKDGSDITALTAYLDLADSATQDADLALDAAVFGRAYELMYMSSDERPTPRLARISPLNAFVVYDDTVEQNPVFGVYYYPVFEAGKSDPKYYRCALLTAEYSQEFTLDPRFVLTAQDEPEQHFFGAVPLDEIFNDGQRQGDFEQVTSLIDAYNTLQSDRVNDKEQFVDALLLIKGQVLGDDNNEKSETYNAIKENRVLELTQDGDASFLTRQFDEASIEVLRKSIVSDIHKISGVPDMSDESFAGNSSGVAMKYKLLNLEQLTKTKERYFAEGLRYRIKCFANVIAAKGGAYIDAANINISFTRSLPANELELAQVVSSLNGVVPQKTLLSLLPFISDPEAAADELAKEKQDSLNRQQQMFANTPLVADNEQ